MNVIYGSVFQYFTDSCGFVLPQESLAFKAPGFLPKCCSGAPQAIREELGLVKELGTVHVGEHGFGALGRGWRAYREPANGVLMNTYGHAPIWNRAPVIADKE